MSGFHTLGGANNHMLYDDHAFELFIVGFLAVFLIPSALARLVRSVTRRFAAPPTPIEIARKQWCVCRACQERADAFEKKSRSKNRLRPSDGLFIIGCLLLGFLLVRVVTRNQNIEPPFDPYAILGVTETATKREISKAYRRLAVIHHPDKNRDNPNAADEFIRVSKAFAALTDEVASENYRKYGNPDGRMEKTMGIGLPSWLQHNSTLMLCMYVLILISFPIIVWRWWRKQSEIMPSAVSRASYGLYFETLKHFQKFRELLLCLAGSLEFADLYKASNDQSLNELAAAIRRSGRDDMFRARCIQNPPPSQNYLVICAHLARILIPEDIQYVLQSILARIEFHLTALTDTVGLLVHPECQVAWPRHMMRGHTTHLTTSILVSQCLIQGVDKDDSPLLQIPGFTEREIRYCNSSRKHSARTIYEFMRHDVEDQKSLLRGFSDEQFLDVVSFCDRYPQALLELHDPEVEDEADHTVHENDTVTVRARLTVMRRAGSVYSPHTPNLPNKKCEVWWVWLADQRLMCPIEVKRLLPKDARGHDQDKKSVYVAGDASDELSKDPRVTIYDLKFTFIAPRQGSYVLELTAAVDCYVGCNRSRTVKMEVLPAVEADSSSNTRYFDTDDESEAESEDSSEASETGGEDGVESNRRRGEDELSDAGSSYEYIEVTASDPEEDRDDVDDLDDLEPPICAEQSTISVVTAESNDAVS